MALLPCRFMNTSFLETNGVSCQPGMSGSIAQPARDHIGAETAKSNRLPTKARYLRKYLIILALTSISTQSKMKKGIEKMVNVTLFIAFCDQESKQRYSAILRVTKEQPTQVEKEKLTSPKAEIKTLDQLNARYHCQSCSANGTK